MSDIDRIIRLSKQIESHLERRHGASGKGLHEKISSIERKLDETSVRHLRYIATIRNKLVHEDDYNRIDDKDQFKRRSKAALKAVGLKKGPPKLLIAAILIAILAAIATVITLASGSQP
ncbi:MAG: DUF4145 domain-containing protein [Planctomycetota bacterium]